MSVTINVDVNDGDLTDFKEEKDFARPAFWLIYYEFIHKYKNVQQSCNTANIEQLGRNMFTYSLVCLYDMNLSIGTFLKVAI